MRVNAEELAMMRTLTLSDKEYGGQMEPYVCGDGCLWRCKERLIRGTGVQSVRGADASNYSGGTAKAVKIASTPFWSEIWHREPVCETGCFGNVFWHSHPLSINLINPPSLGDIAAHCVLGQLRNHAEHRQRNTMLIVAFEGIYEYGIDEWRMARFIQQLPKTAEREIPENLAARLRASVFDELRGGFDAFDEEIGEFIDNNKMGRRGAPRLHDAQWLCNRKHGCVDAGAYNFEYARSLRDPKFVKRLRQFHADNSYIKTLRKHGFWYRYHSYGDDISIDVSLSCL